MKALDTDVLSLVLQGEPAYVQKLSAIPPADRSIPIVVADQLLRGRLNLIRQAEAGKTQASLADAYSFLALTLNDLRSIQVLCYSPKAELLAQTWRKQKIRVGISDLRIAALCIVHSATLISRNRRDFDQIPGLSVEYW